MTSRRPVRRLCPAPFQRLTVLMLATAAFACGSNGADDSDDDTPDTTEDAASAPAADSTAARERDAERDGADAPSAVPGPRASESPAAASGGDDAPEAPAAAESGSAEADAPLASPAAAFTFAACSATGGPYSECDSIYVTAVQASPARCIQLTIDNCGTYGRQGFSADTPSRWRLASGSVGAAANPCELGVFYSGNPSLDDATGSISWNEATPRPTDLVFDLELQQLPSANGQPDPISLATSEPLQLTECDE